MTRGQTFWAAVAVLFLTYIKSIKHGDARKISPEQFFLENTDSFFDSHSTSKPSYEEAVEQLFDVREEEKFFKKENDLFEKMKDDEAFFFKQEQEDALSKVINKKKPTVLSQQNRFCNCKGVYCKCCSSIKLFGKEKFRGCVEIEYVPRDFAMFITVSINGYVIITRVLSGRNPHPFCASTPYIPLVSFCIRLYDIHHNPHGLSLCMRLEATSMRQILFSISFDCIKIDDYKISFYMPPNATTFGVVGFHLGDIDPYISYQDWTKLHIPLPDIPPSPTTTLKPKHHFLWFKWK